MTFYKLLPFLLTGCSLHLDAGKLRSDAAGTAGTAGIGAAGAAGTAGTGAAGTAGTAETSGHWSDADLSRLGFALLGSAEVGATGAVLTRDSQSGEVGGIAQIAPVELGVDPKLHVALEFRIQSGDIPGDGLAIVLHGSTSGPSALGLGGGAMGYGGLSPCLAIEVDTLKQVDVDPPTPHLAFMPGCQSEMHGSVAQIAGNPVDGATWLLNVDWDRASTLLNAQLIQLETGQPTATLSEPVDLASLLGPRAFVVVTAATGARHSTHSVTSLQVVGGGIGSRTLSP